MTRLIRRFAVALFIATLAAAGLSGCASSSGTASDIVTLTRQATAWDEAIVRKDRAAVEANMADDFRQIDARANVVDKAAFLEGILAKELTINPYGVEDFDVRIYGDVALLSGRTLMHGTWAGEAFTSHYRYIDVYVRRGGVWKVASVQITKVP